MHNGFSDSKNPPSALADFSIREVPKHISVDLHRCRIAKRLPDITFYLILRREVDLFEQFRRDRDAACRLDLAKGRTFVHGVV